MIREDIRKGQMHVFFVALLFNHIGFLWRSYYQQNQSKAFKDSKNEKYEISIEILIVKYRKNQCLNIFLLNLFNSFLTNNAEYLLPKAWAGTRILFRSTNFISTKWNAKKTKHDHKLELYPYSFSQKVTLSLVLHISVRRV